VPDTQEVVSDLSGLQGGEARCPSVDLPAILAIGLLREYNLPSSGIEALHVPHPFSGCGLRPSVHGRRGALIWVDEEGGRTSEAYYPLPERVQQVIGRDRRILRQRGLNQRVKPLVATEAMEEGVGPEGPRIETM